jgi:uncharacterized protein (DUF362 family)/NAD-dependent dihydropyrimidine dehydrogenase PreA subunit
MKNNLAEKQKPIVAVERCLRYEMNEVREALRKVLQPFGGLESFVTPGQKVLIKPNLLAAAAPAEAVTTHPAVIRALVEMVQEAGGEAFIGDNPGNDDQAETLKKAGLQEIIDQSGAQALIFKGSKDHQGSGFQERLIPLARELDQVDLVINAAKLKTHALTGLTGAVKNNYGLLFGNIKKRYHMEHPLPLDFSRLLIDIYLAAKPALSILDAIVAMEGTGPRRGKPRQLGLLMASNNAVALDSVAAEITGFLPAQVTTIAAARELKLSGAFLEDIEIRGLQLEESRVKDFDRGPGGHGKISRLIASFPLAYFRNLLYARRPYPRVDPELCVECGICAENCPLRVIDCSCGIPEFDLYECIRCYCCQEHCAEGAIKLGQYRSSSP